MKSYWWEKEKPKKTISKNTSNIEELVQTINNLKKELAEEKSKNPSNHSKRAVEILKNIENLADDYDE